PVCGEEEVQAVLERSLVRFPFAVTKATAMVLAGESRARRLLWGKILHSDKRTAPLQVQLVLIDLEAGRQRQLPLVKGSYVQLFKLQEELLRQAARAIAEGPREITLPALNLALPEYEAFIKSLLLSDAAKKLELLQAAEGRAERSDFIHFELAKVFLQKRDAAAGRSHLERVGDSPFFRAGKEFLLALADLYDGEMELSLNRFVRMQQQNAFPVATHNNLGVIYLRQERFPLAEKCLRYALYLRDDPAVLANLVLLLRDMGRSQAARLELSGALRRFPDDARLLEMFAFFLSEAENGAELAQAFRNTVPLPLTGEKALLPEPPLMNPFALEAWAAAAAPGNLDYIEARSLFLENDLDGAERRAEEAMESHPFEPGNHHLLALICLQKGQLALAERYAQSALFLAETLDNYLLQLRVLQAGNQRERFRATLALARRQFPDSPELHQLGDGSR
ncbi:MAG: hypothetical protein JXO51_01100, partial [Candidatus Aminicenantes bacterium]|nr:hypothetical protein [Candidatus Aminicenantes bacterium]